MGARACARAVNTAHIHLRRLLQAHHTFIKDLLGQHKVHVNHSQRSLRILTQEAERLRVLLLIF